MGIRKATIASAKRAESALPLRKKFWRRRLAGAPAHLQKRLAHEMARRWLQRFKNVVPPAHEVALANEAPEAEPSKPDDLRIVIAADPKNVPAANRARLRRKSLRRALHDLPDH